MLEVMKKKRFLVNREKCLPIVGWYSKVLYIDDLFESRFADQLPASFDEKISVIEQKKWFSQVFHDEALKDVTALTTTVDKNVQNMPTVTNLDDIKVKQRIANCWPVANKDIIKKGNISPRLA